MAKLKVGVVGLGGIGNNHARCYTANPHTDVVAVCDMNKERADKAASTYGAQAFYSVRSMLKSGIKLDGCSMCSAGVENGGDQRHRARVGDLRQVDRGFGVAGAA